MPRHMRTICSRLQPLPCPTEHGVKTQSRVKKCWRMAIEDGNMQTFLGNKWGLIKMFAVAYASKAVRR